MIQAILILASACLVPAPASQALVGGGGVVDLVQVELVRPGDLTLVRRFASDIDDHYHSRTSLHLFADDDEQQRLRQLGLTLEVLQEDLVQYYLDRNSNQALSGGGGSFAGYRTYAEMTTRMAQMAAIYSAIVSQPINVGTTVEGRTIWGMRISSTPNVHDPNKPVVWYDGLHHAREPISGEAVLRFAEYVADGYLGNAELHELVQTRNLLFLPIVNPDGYEFNRLLSPGGGALWRKNMRPNYDGSLGVDLNRNYDWEWGPQWPGSSSIPGFNDYHGPAAFSEPECRALRDFALAQPPLISVSCHSYGGACVFPWGYDAVFTPHDGIFRSYSKSVAEPLDWIYGAVWESLGFANGNSLDYQYGTHRTLALALEIGTIQDGFWPTGPRIAELCDDLRPAFTRVARLAGPAPRICSSRLLEGLGDGDGWKDPGEVWVLEVVLENEGLVVARGRLSPQIPMDVSGLSMPPTNFALAAGAQRTFEFSFLISDSAPIGELRSIQLQMVTDEVSEEVQIGLPLGEGRLLATDDFDWLDTGWEVSGQGTGRWERGQPELVTDPMTGLVIQPSTDASPAGTGSCFVTGALAGNLATSNDVDGQTQLVSPRFDGSGFEYMQLDFKRWFASVAEFGPADDQLRVEASRDNGQTWVTLVELDNETQWFPSRFDLTAVLLPSNAMRLRFSVSDDPDNGLTEALVDELRVFVFSEQPVLGIWGRSHAGDTPEIQIHAPEHAGKTLRILRALGDKAGVPTAGVSGSYVLNGGTTTLWSGTLDSAGRALVPVPLPQALAPVTGAFYFQGLVDEGNAQAAWTNGVRMVVNN
ncbi:MAG: hypothetical protein ACI9F9_001530 [Candidatus Paceibacteria bacterium]|jgi:hypothetical protein